MTSARPLDIKNLTVSYQQLEALRNINLTVKTGRVTGIIGPNGAGKSTLIKAMMGLITPRMGSVMYGQQPLTSQRDLVAYVPQRANIDWDYPATVWDVVMMGRVKKTGWLRPFSRMSREKASYSLERVGLRALGNRPIGQLSGGQQQRVFLARALAQDADIFFFDEPFVGVDQKTETIIFDIFQELAKNNKIVMVVNHDLGESINNFDDLILLNKQLIAYGKRENVLTDINISSAYGGKVDFASQNDVA